MEDFHLDECSMDLTANLQVPRQMAGLKFAKVVAT